MLAIYTIGFARKPLREFIGLLKTAGVRCVVDIRLRNTSQLAGWSKYPDFQYLLEEGFGIQYEHQPRFAPSGEILDRYKSDRDWPSFEASFVALINERNPISEADRFLSAGPACLLCTEPAADKCHRRLVAEFIGQIRAGLTIRHL